MTMNLLRNILTTSVLTLFFILKIQAQNPNLISQEIPGTKVGFQMALVPGGSFQMGSEAQQRSIQLDSFWMGVTEVGYDEFIVFYQKQYDTDASTNTAKPYSADAVSRPTPQYIDYTYGMGKSGFPAVSMTQQAALRYCQWLYGKTGVFYRLPTEAEWEFACRLGQMGKEPLEEQAWFFDNGYEKYHELATKKPNALGLYDMLGNVAEWTLDFYDEDYLQNLQGDPAPNPWVEPTKRHSRTVKGGSYDSTAEECTCGHRKKSEPKWQARDPQIPKSKWWNPDSPFVGFRLARPVKQPAPEAVAAFFAKAIKD
jgi:formylglycine-generating enzyme required for sulfatase activity